MEIKLASLELDNSLRIKGIKDPLKLISELYQPGENIKTVLPVFPFVQKNGELLLNRYLDFSFSIPRSSAAIFEIPGDGYCLLVCKTIDMLSKGLSHIRMGAALFDREKNLVHSNDDFKELLGTSAGYELSRILPENFLNDFDTYIESTELILRDSEIGDQIFRWQIFATAQHQFLLTLVSPYNEQEDYRQILEYSVDGIYQTDKAGRLIYGNQTLAELFGYSDITHMKTHVKRASSDIYVNEEDRSKFLKLLDADKPVIGFECEMKTFNGSTMWVRQNAQAIRSEHGETEYIVGTVTNISEIKKAEQAQKTAEANYERLFNDAQAGLFQTTLEGNLVRANRTLASMLGFASVDECLNAHKNIRYTLYKNPNDRTDIIEKLQEKRRLPETRVEFQRKDGSSIWVLMTSNTVTDPSTGKALFEGSIVNISNQVENEKQIQYLADHDFLTDLPNRKTFNDTLHARYKVRTEYQDSHFAILFLDLDHFKDINDTMGHVVGDELLKRVSERLKLCLRSSDMVYRIGGDEFAIITNHSDHATLIQLAISVLHAFNRAFEIDENFINVTPSIGIVDSSQVSLENVDNFTQELLTAADLALYQSKCNGRNQYQFYVEDMRTNLQREKYIEHGLSQALTTGDGLHLYYQAVVDASTKRISSAEALLRWQYKDEWVAPAEFIPIAEKSGQIAKIDLWVIDAIAKHCEQIKTAGFEIPLSFNLSSYHFNHNTLRGVLDRLQQSVEKFASQLVVELTERVVFENTQNVIDNLQLLHHWNIGIALDDFGTGYSSLSYLTQFPIDKLKVDQSFVQRMHIDPKAKAVVTASVQIAKTLGLKVVAEGVETAEHLKALAGLEFDELQGYYFARPCPFEKLLLELENETPIDSEQA